MYAAVTIRRRTLRSNFYVSEQYRVLHRTRSIFIEHGTKQQVHELCLNRPTTCLITTTSTSVLPDSCNKKLLFVVLVSQLSCPCHFHCCQIAEEVTSWRIFSDSNKIVVVNRSTMIPVLPDSCNRNSLLLFEDTTRTPCVLATSTARR
jgi:hypothetical protein